MGARALKVTAVVLNWKRPDDTIACVRSIHTTSPGTDVVVVDNASGDGSVARIKAAYPDITLIENEANLGYAGGNNAGIRRARDGGADAIFVLNNDVVVEPGCIGSLADMFEHGGEEAILAPVSLRADDPGICDFYTARVDLKNMALIAHGRDEPWSGGSRPVPTDYATGSALFISAAWASRGVFDERFFLVWEDVDLCRRAMYSTGVGAIVVPSARVMHARSVSFGGEGSPLYQYFYVRNSFLIVEKHASRFRKRRTRALLERRYRGWLDKRATTPAIRAAIDLGLQHGLSQRWGPPPAELLP
ncbi:MAG: glycosyltransferase family 2 protein [Actinomycetota bacterium]